MLATRGLVGLAVLAFAGVALSASTGVNWQKDLDSACKLAAQTNRLVLVHVWGKSCPKCVEMDRATLSKPEVAKNLEATFVCVKINAEQNSKLVAQYGIQRIPADVVLTPDGKVLNGSVGFYPPAQYLERLNKIAASAPRNSGRSPSGTPGTQGAPGMPGTSGASGVAGGNASAPDRSLVAAGVQPPYGSAPIDPRSAGGNPAADRDPASRWNNSAPRPPSSNMPASVGASAAGTAGGYSVPPGGNSPERGPGLAGRNEEPSAAAGSRAIPPTDRLARWPSGNDAASSRRDGPAASANGLSASAGGPSAVANRASAEPQGNRSADRQADSSAGRRINPPLDLDGYCAVSLVEHGRWARGDRRYGVIHRGRTYLFVGPQEADRFYTNPDRFAPVLSGNDVVLYVDQGQSVPGRRAHGAVYEDRVYLFSSEASYEKFTQEPDRYIRMVANPGKKIGRGDDARRDRQDPPSDSGVARDPRDSRGSRDSRDGRDLRSGRDSLTPRDGGDSRFSRDDRALRDSDNARDESLPNAGRRY